MKHYLHTLTAAASITLLTLQGGCVDQDSDPEEVDEEELGEAEQPILGSLLCATGSRDNVNDYGCDLVGGEYCSYYTPDNTYGNDYLEGEDCQPYMTLSTSTPSAPPGTNMSIQYTAHIGSPLPDNEEDCLESMLELAGYYFDENGDHYELAGTHTRRAHWTGTSCHLEPIHVYTTLNCLSTGCERSPIVAARQYEENGLTLPITKRVVLGIYRTDL